MSDFRIMRWHGAMDGPWSPEAARKFREQGYDGLTILAGRDWIPRTLNFVEELEGLRSFSFTGKVQDDSSAFRVLSLEELSLVTGSKARLPEVLQPRLRRVAMIDRPDINVNSRWPAVASLRMGEWKGRDLRVLSGASELTEVYLEGRRQQGTLEGVESCVSLKSLTVVNYSVLNADPLRSLKALSTVKLLAAEPTPTHGKIDLSVLAGSRIEKLWVSNAAGFLNLDSLTDTQSMREMRIIGSRLSESDMRTLSAFPKWIRVQIVDG